MTPRYLTDSTDLHLFFPSPRTHNRELQPPSTVRSHFRVYCATLPDSVLALRRQKSLGHSVSASLRQISDPFTIRVFMSVQIFSAFHISSDFCRNWYLAIEYSRRMGH